MNEAVTPTEYTAFQRAYDFFNTEVFAGELPQVLVILRRGQYLGYFACDRFQHRVEESKVHELALNPDHFTGKPDEEILSTLVHEMAHVWRWETGKKKLTGYHDKRWAEKMKQIGLQPSHTGKPGGRETGQHMSHYIAPEGPFANACAKLLATGYQLHWQSSPPDPKAKGKLKEKFTCPDCGQNAWGKRTAKLSCDACHGLDGGRHVMIAQSA
jgi:hypothetical protein